MASNTVDRNARREAARRQADALRNQAKAQERKQRLIIGIIGLVVVALIGVAGYIIWNASQQTALSDFEGEAPAGANEHGGIVVGAAGVGGPNPDAVEVQVYMDFACPWCATFEEVNGEDLQELIADGTATAIYHPLDFLGEYSLESASAMAAVADRSPEHMVDFMHHVFATVEPGSPVEQLEQAAVEVGVSEDVAATINDGAYTEWVERASDQARNDGVQGTPTIVIDGNEMDPEQEGQNWIEPGEMAEFVEAHAEG